MGGSSRYTLRWHCEGGGIGRAYASVGVAQLRKALFCTLPLGVPEPAHGCCTSPSRRPATQNQHRLACTERLLESAPEAGSDPASAEHEQEGVYDQWAAQSIAETRTAARMLL